MTILVLIALMVFLVMLRASVRSKTAFVSVFALTVIVSFLMAIDVIGFISGIVITVFVGLFILWLDEIGILA